MPWRVLNSLCIVGGVVLDPASILNILVLSGSGTSQTTFIFMFYGVSKRYEPLAEIVKWLLDLNFLLIEKDLLEIN